MWGVVRRHAEERRAIQLGDPHGVDDVPDRLVAGYCRLSVFRLSSEVVDDRMAVVDFVELLFDRVGEILRGDGPPEIRMVQVGQDRFSGLLFAFGNGLEILTDDFGD